MKNVVYYFIVFAVSTAPTNNRFHDSKVFLTFFI